MKTNTKMVPRNRVTLSIRSAVRQQVAQAYREWRNQHITTEEFSTWMFDIRITSLAIVENMENFGIIDEDERETLDRFIRSLTETY